MVWRVWLKFNGISTLVPNLHTHTRTHTHTHTHTHTYIYIYIYPNTLADIFILIYMYIYIYIHIKKNRSVNVYVYKNIYIYIYIYIYEYISGPIHFNIYIYTSEFLELFPGHWLGGSYFPLKVPANILRKHRKIFKNSEKTEIICNAWKTTQNFVHAG